MMVNKDWIKDKKFNYYQKNLGGYHFLQIRLGKTKENIHTYGIKKYYIDFYEDGDYKETERFSSQAELISYAKKYMEEN